MVSIVEIGWCRLLGITVMKINKKFWAAVFVCASVLLAGCDEKTPSDKLTSETIRPIAEGDALDGMIVEDFKKENGWQDTNAVNTYSVRYSYNLKLTKPLPEVALGLANQILSGLNDAKNNPGFMGINSFGANVNLSQEASDWLTPQGDKFSDRRDAFLSKCAPCINYWNQDGDEDVVRVRRYAYIAAWSRLEGMGFKDTSTVGDNVPRLAWANFMKTENGWMHQK